MRAFTRSELTDSLVRYLRSHPKDTALSYDELTRAMSTTITASSHHLKYARYILERDANAVWVAVSPKVGLRRLTDREIADRQRRWWINGATRKLMRGRDEADVVETEMLDLTQQARFAVDNIQRELALDSLSAVTRRRMEKVSRGTSNDLPAFNAIEWMISLTPRKPR